MLNENISVAVLLIFNVHILEHNDVCTLGDKRTNEK